MKTMKTILIHACAFDTHELVPAQNLDEEPNDGLSGWDSELNKAMTIHFYTKGPFESIGILEFSKNIRMCSQEADPDILELVAFGEQPKTGDCFGTA